MHQMLGRQLKKLGFALDAPVSAEQLASLLQVVSRAYHSADEDRMRLERSLQVSSREMEERTREIRRLAFHDKLTGLPNRVLFYDRLQFALTKIARHGNPVTVIFFDLDSFKSINDRLGHDTGDEILRGVAERVSTILRPGDTTARLGGDEFLVLLEEVHEQRQAVAIGKRITRVLSLPFTTSGGECEIGASVGIATTQNSGLEASELVKQADAAMYNAKASGKNCVSVFRPSSKSALGKKQAA